MRILLVFSVAVLLSITASAQEAEPTKQLIDYDQIDITSFLQQVPACTDEQHATIYADTTATLNAMEDLLKGWMQENKTATFTLGGILSTNLLWDDVRRTLPNCAGGVHLAWAIDETLSAMLGTFYLAESGMVDLSNEYFVLLANGVIRANRIHIAMKSD